MHRRPQDRSNLGIAHGQHRCYAPCGVLAAATTSAASSAATSVASRSRCSGSSRSRDRHGDVLGLQRREYAAQARIDIMIDRLDRLLALAGVHDDFDDAPAKQFVDG